MNADWLVKGEKTWESGGSSEIEELARSMTFQVAMIGTDGWVLASGTRAYDPRAVDTSVGRSSVGLTSTTSKIVNCPSLSLIYAFSGGAASVRAGILLTERAADIPRDGRRHVLSKIAFEVSQGRPTGDSVIVLFYDEYPELWSVPIGSVAVPYKDLAFGGGGNLAMYFPTRFHGENRRSIRELELLAAFTVLEAHALNPTVVAGLELWSCYNGVVSPASADRMTLLRRHHAKLQKRLRRDF